MKWINEQRVGIKGLLLDRNYASLRAQEKRGMLTCLHLVC